MSTRRIGNATITDMTSNVENYEDNIDPATQDYPGTSYTPEWDTWYSYLKDSADIMSCIDAMASWIVGKGYKADEKTQEKLRKITGNGKDSFNTILYNQMFVAIANGDSFAEIITDKSGRLRNLKPMSPKTTIKSNYGGIITSYEEFHIPGETPSDPFKVDKIFHLSWGRLGSECHGRPFAEVLKKIMEMKGEAMQDLRIVFHRYVKPLIIAEADTDDDTELTALKVKLDNTVKLGENMVVPKGSFSSERISIPQYSTLDPLPWIKYLDEYFTIVSRVPAVIRGSGKETTEASSRVLYVAFQQMIEWGQLYLEEQLKLQLGIEIELEFPVDLDPAVKESISKQRSLNNPSPRGDNIKA
jgi:hypothetical protein